MSVSNVVTILGALLLTGLLAWYFFGPKRSRQAQMSEGVQIITVTVKGGYSPDIIEVASGVPVRMLFDRQESGDCTSRVVFPHFKVNQSLPAFETTTVEFLPEEPGEYEFACGMNMIRGRLLVVPGGAAAVDVARDSAMAFGTEPEMMGHLPGSVATSPQDGASSQGISQVAGDVRLGRALDNPVAMDAGSGEEGERKRELADLKRRVILGALLTTPVLFAVMVTDFFGATWMPASLMNPWLQLALISPVMVYTGWPIHRTGWLALGHRTADMNSLITLGTIAAFGFSLVVTAAPGSLPPEAQGVYYEAVGVIITLIMLGRLLETKAKAGTGEAIRTLIGLQPRTARVIRDQVESEVAIDDVALGDVVVVRPGEKLPVDGQVAQGRSSVDESMVTG